MVNVIGIKSQHCLPCPSTGIIVSFKNVGLTNDASSTIIQSASKPRELFCFQLISKIKRVSVIKLTFPQKKHIVKTTQNKWN